MVTKYVETERVECTGENLTEKTREARAGASRGVSFSH
jgi:hypothetical protein